MSILSILACLFSCGGKESGTYTTEDITSVSISCSAPDRSQSYLFFVYEQEGKHLLDAECFTYDVESEISLSAHELDTADFSSLLALIEETDCMKKASSTNSMSNVLDIKDADNYGFAVSFKDGKRYIRNERQPKLEAFFYDIAQKYSDA